LTPITLPYTSIIDTKIGRTLVRHVRDTITSSSSSSSSLLLLLFLPVVPNYYYCRSRAVHHLTARVTSRRRREVNFENRFGVFPYSCTGLAHRPSHVGFVAAIAACGSRESISPHKSESTKIIIICS